MSSQSSSFVISDQEFNMFHTIDRTLYSLLVMDLCRDPVEALRFVALWLWLERVGFKQVVKRILSLPFALINELADEALVCLNLVHNDQVSTSGLANDVPLMQNLIHSDLCLRFFADHRVIATQGLARVTKEVCTRTLRDIMQIAIERNATQVQAQQAMVQPGLGQVVGLPLPRTNEVVPADDRTMFVTFSKGYPVQEWEVREFFIRLYGDCIESFHMQEVLPNEQPLFARIVCYSTAYIETILDGNVKVKFNINGKHVWVRRFVSKYRRQPANSSLKN
ncbi:hypothetical protein V6N13_031169 [Hibiscus sabdariffa]|uniref:Uncharacterized protein n=1 Tax=Hibiscus sabdariffa TaxID=183260 RepID=A0ABR2CL60_9ROSI